jgi:acetyl-CoA C-acetyltransferase
MDNAEVYIVSFARTPIGRFGGALKSLGPAELGSFAIKGALERGRVAAANVDISIMGNILRSGHGQDIARQAAVKAGIPVEKDAYTVDMVCSSGMMSIINAAQMIKCGDAEIVVAGGTESMSQAALSVRSEVRWGVKALIGRKLEFIDTMQHDGLTDPFNMRAMGSEADDSAKSHNATREGLDQIALESHRRSDEATKNGSFSSEIVPVEAEGKMISADEGIRPDSTIEKLAALKPAFSKEGLHTAGNSSQLSDGASALVLASKRAVSEYGLAPVARLVGYAWTGIESVRFVEAPALGLQALQKKVSMNLKDVDYFENNEAFAVSSFLLNKVAGVSYEQLNPFGGAIALGHPIGASGARIVGTLINVLDKRKKATGVASLCHGTGGSTALMIERQ